MIFRKCITLLAFLCSTSVVFAQASVSGIIRDGSTKEVLPFASAAMLQATDSAFVQATLSDENGLVQFSNIAKGEFILKVVYVGYDPFYKKIFIGALNQFYDMGDLELVSQAIGLDGIEIIAKKDDVGEKLDKKTYNVGENLTQAGGSLLQAVQNLPGITVQDGKILIRGNDKVVVLIDGKQTALTGFGNQMSLDNIPASAIERIEIINNPSAKYDANGNGGIINIIYKKNIQEGWNGKVGLTTGVGALGIKKNSLPGIRPQYQYTPKLNPSVSLNYKKKNINLYFQGDYLYTETLNKNEFVDRYYDDGSVRRQQTKRNRDTGVATGKLGLDWNWNESNQLSFSTLFSSERILDRGDEPFYNSDLTERFRLWQFLEDELKTTATASTTYLHRFAQRGHTLSTSFNYTFHRENEKYYFTNVLPTYTGYDAFKLISDEHVADITIDYVKPLAKGRLEAGVKYRYRNIPTNMLFIPGFMSPLDTNAGGWATYKENIPASYLNYVLENKKYELEAGVRFEYVRVDYLVNPEHNTYASNGYNYFQPFPNIRYSYKFNDSNKISLFFNRRVDRPNEVDIRIFPKYDDAEIIKVGNPELSPQFTTTAELGYKSAWNKGYVYGAVYHKIADGTITRIASSPLADGVIYTLMQNAGRSYNTGAELLFSQLFGKKVTGDFNLNIYQNTIEAFSVINKYPVENTFNAARQSLISWNVKSNWKWNISPRMDAQLTATYLAPDLIPQGKIDARFSIDAGVKAKSKNGKIELFANASDIFNTMRIHKTIQGDGFYYNSSDYYETQVVRAGFNYKF